MNFLYSKYLFAVTVVTLFGGAFAAVASAELVTLTATPASDGTVQDNFPADGSFDSSLPAIEAYQLDFGTGILERRGIMEFAISGSLSGKTITAVELDFRPNTVQATMGTFFLYAGNGSVEVADATTASIELGTFNIAGSPNDFIQLVPTAGFQTLLDGGATHFGIRIESQNGFDVYFLDSETATGAGRPDYVPALNITAVPEPSGFLFLAFAGLAQVCLCRFR